MPKAHALVAQWIVHTGSNGKIGGSTPEGTYGLYF